MVRIRSVIARSLAERAGITGGTLLTVNGNEINDVLDYKFYIAEKSVTLEIEQDGAVNTFSIKKREYDGLGLEFDSFLMDSEHSCRNNCIFCFIDQNPKGLRESLYFKDDDDRLSFLKGNYITLTNLSERDIERIIRMKLPLNISLHTMNPDLRVKMMRNRFAGDSVAILKRLLSAGNRLNIQLVLCPGYNDGEELRHTLEELLGANPENIESIACVPVGLTAHRENLTPLSPFGKDTAKAVIETIAEYQPLFEARNGSKTVYASDEFFLIAGLPIPGADYYESYPQYENGVGMLRSLIEEFTLELDSTETAVSGCSTIVITGESAFETVDGLVRLACEKFPEIRCEVVKVKNRFFGGHVTVTGLLTGSDIITELKEREFSGTLLLSADMFKKDTELFLDDTTLSDVEKALNLTARKITRDGAVLVQNIIGNV
jgi:putative radical SAM enzyme (TIGR03279 family)